MRKLIAYIGIFGTLCLYSCSPKITTSIDNYGVSVQKAYTMKPDTLTVVQMDSVVKVDKLPVLSKWTENIYKDEDTNNNIIYKTLFDKTTNTIYTIKIMNNSVYVMSKRKIQTR